MGLRVSVEARSPDAIALEPAEVGLLYVSGQYSTV